MKTIKELEEIRNNTRKLVNQRMDRDSTRVVVGMATCGIAAGARSVLLAIMEEVNSLGLSDVVVAQTGCIGMCMLEPIVEVIRPGEEKVTYVKVDADKARRIFKEHILGGKAVEEYTIHVVNGKVLNSYSRQD